MPRASTGWRSGTFWSPWRGSFPNGGRGSGSLEQAAAFRLGPGESLRKSRAWRQRVWNADWIDYASLYGTGDVASSAFASLKGPVSLRHGECLSRRRHWQ